MLRPPASAWPLVALLGLVGCEGGGGVAGIDVQLLGADGRSPVDGMRGSITVAVRHAGQPVDCAADACMAEVRDGAYELLLPIASFDGRTEIQVDVRGEDGARWIGASPTFVPFGEGVDVFGGLRLLVGEPGRCRPLSLRGVTTADAPSLAPARARVATVRRRNVVLLAGGEARSGANDDHVDLFDQLLIDARPLASWDRSLEIGPAHGIELSEDVSLVVGARSLRFARDGAGPPIGRELRLDGAGHDSAVVRLGANGAAVLGGQASPRVHWIGSDGMPRGSTELLVARTAPAAALMSGGVLVVGGEERGGPVAEWVRALQPGALLELSGETLPLGARGGHLLPAPDGRAAIWIGGSVDGVPSPETYVLRRCPEACAVEAGPRWERARADVAATTTSAGALWLIGGFDELGAASTAVDRVVWDAGQPRIEAGPSLSEARAEAAAFEHAFGTVIVVGGRAAGGLSSSLELCVPERLDPL